MSELEAAIAYAKKHQKILVSKICKFGICKPSENPFTLFMAGSPGSGKTEFSKNLLKELERVEPSQRIVRLDTDELRELLPQYIGNNSDTVQKAATILFDKSYDYIQKKKLNVIVDTTFASPRALSNVDRAVNRGRQVGILYLYQDPFTSWEYTKKREKLEGRTVPKKVFINAYFSAKKNVQLIKEKYGNQIELNLFEKDEQHNFNKKAKFNIQNLDKYIKERYTQGELERLLSYEV